MPPATLRIQLEAMSKTELADYYASRVPRATQRAHPGQHINWWTYDKLAALLGDAGFEHVYRSQPQQSRFEQMRGTGRRTGFDSTFPEISLFVEAVN